MKHLKKILFALLCALLLAICCPACGSGGPGNQQARLEKAEQKLAAGREELAAQLRAYYMGQADEAKTARLIELVEKQRLLVESLRAGSPLL